MNPSHAVCVVDCQYQCRIAGAVKCLVRPSSFAESSNNFPAICRCSSNVSALHKSSRVRYGQASELTRKSPHLFEMLVDQMNGHIQVVGEAEL